MTDQQGGDARVQNLKPVDVARGMTEGRMLLATCESRTKSRSRPIRTRW